MLLKHFDADTLSPYFSLQGGIKFGWGQVQVFVSVICIHEPV